MIGFMVFSIAKCGVELDGVKPDDGRTRCKRCLKAEAKSKEGKR